MNALAKTLQTLHLLRYDWPNKKDGTPKLRLLRFRLLRNDRLHTSEPQTNVRFAQPKGLGLKVGDEFTVPLCAIHHHQIHITGKENAWWQERKIDPLKVAASLWQQ